VLNRPDPEGRTGPEPAVTVLLATYNGLPWLPDQVATILDQQGVVVELVVSDDGSDDGTWEWLQDLSEREARVRLLERPERRCGPAGNFYRLVREAGWTASGVVAFADQDDLWRAGKLAASAALISDGAADGVSSDVVAFGADGKRHLVRKSYPQRRLDYLFEGAGPGSTIVLSARLAALIKDQLDVADGHAAAVEFHDWLAYVVCRAAGWRWIIQPVATVEYRQHGANAFGANFGGRPAVARLNLIRAGWHRRQATTLTRVALDVAQPDDRLELEPVLALLEARGWPARWRLARLSGQMRRRARDRWIMAVLIVVGLW
jgi:rhamnosyltransferase